MFSRDDFSKTLRELGLTPSAVSAAPFKLPEVRLSDKLYKGPDRIVRSPHVNCLKVDGRHVENN